MNDNRPKLMELSSDGQAQKPEELSGQHIVITDSIEVETRDGRLSTQWVVRTPDRRTRVFWSAGKGPTLAVRQWFRDNPRTPLHCTLERAVDQWGNNVWRIQQVDAESSDGQNNPAQGSVDEQLSAAGL